MNNKELVETLSNHIKEIERIKTPHFLGTYDYQKATELLLKTKMFSDKYFPLRSYGLELIPIKFKPIYTSYMTTPGNYKDAWDTSIIDLLSVAKTMREDASLNAGQSPASQLIQDPSAINKLVNKITQLEKENSQQQDSFSQILITHKKQYEKLELKFKRHKKIILFISLLSVLTILLWTFNGVINWAWLSDHPKKIGMYISFQLLIIFSLLRIITKSTAIKVIDVLIALTLLILSLI